MEVIFFKALGTRKKGRRDWRLIDSGKKNCDHKELMYKLKEDKALIIMTENL